MMGAPVRLFVRDRERVAHLAALGVEILQGDLSNRYQVAAAMEGVERIFCSNPLDQSMVEKERNLVVAALTSNVRHIVKLSTALIGPKWGLSGSRWHWEAEETIRASGVPYTFLRPLFFMQHLLRFASEIRSYNAFYAPVGGARISMVDARDVATVAARVLTQGNHLGCAYNLSGAEALTFNEAAEQLSLAINRRVHYVTRSYTEYQEGLLAAGMPPWQALDMVRFFDLVDKGVAAEITSETRALLGRSPRTFGQFARDHAVLFKRPGALSAMAADVSIGAA